MRQLTMTTLVKSFVALAAVLMLNAAPSEAIAIISFDQAGVINPNGVVTYDGIGGPLVGTAIPFDTIRGANTPFNSNTSVACNGCTLNFTTGPNTLQNNGVEYEWGGNVLGSFVVRGRSLALGILVDSVLLNGTITGASFEPGQQVGFEVSVGGQDFKHPAIVEHWFGPQGLPPLFSYSNTEILIGGATFDVVNTGDFTADVTNADIDNIIPEPTSSVIMLLGLAGLAGFSRRRRS